MSDWMSLFSHGSDRSSCLFGRLTDLGNRFEAHDFVDFVRWVLLLPQLPHLFNEEQHPNFDYHIGKCHLDRHAKTGPPLSVISKWLTYMETTRGPTAPKPKQG